MADAKLGGEAGGGGRRRGEGERTSRLSTRELLRGGQQARFKAGAGQRHHLFQRRQDFQRCGLHQIPRHALPGHFAPTINSSPVLRFPIKHLHIMSCDISVSRMRALPSVVGGGCRIWMAVSWELPSSLLQPSFSTTTVTILGLVSTSPCGRANL